MKASHFTTLSMAVLALAGCATSDDGRGLNWMHLDVSNTDSDPRQASNASNEVGNLLPQNEAAREDLETTVSRTRIPNLRDAPRNQPTGVSAEPQLPDTLINITLPPQPLPTFINTVFGEILEQPFTLGPGVAEREELISLRSVVDMQPATFLTLIEQALQDYGLGVTYNEGLYRVIELSELRAQMPRFIRSRAYADVPVGLRPVVQFVELEAIDVADMQQILQQAFPDREVLSLQNNRRLNTLTISGLADDVNAAMALVEQMDELRFAGTQVATLSIRNWNAEELTASMSDILTLEGYMVGVGISAPRTLTLLPLNFTNQIMIFAANRDLADRAIALATRLDREAFNAEVRTAHVYQAQHTEASQLAQIVNGVLNQTGNASSSAGQNSSSLNEATDSREDRSENSESASQASVGRNITVDESGNRVIFFGTQAEYIEFFNLAQQLDTPVPEVMIEVTIAEITLTDENEYGLNFIFNSENRPEFRADLELGGSFSGTVRTGELRIRPNLAANNNQINVLSTPRIVTRSGSDAQVQVGNDVPVLTSQRAANTSRGGSTDVLQSVQYRQTGVILNVTPRVYSNNRIDLTIQQETSNTATNTNAGISSPLIAKRSMSSQLSLQDGQTAVLGGLIENRYTRGNTGPSLLKDIPLIGTPFRQESMEATRTMLVVLVTPYVLDTRNDRQRVVDTLVRAMNTGFENQNRPNRTIFGPTEPMQIRPAGAGLSAAPAGSHPSET